MYYKPVDFKESKKGFSFGSSERTEFSNKRVKVGPGEYELSI
jgi:hypothetical protein